MTVITLAGTAAALVLYFRPRGGPAGGKRLVLPVRSGSPLILLGIVIALIYVNQVLVTVYVLRVHHGDPSFIARYLPAGWFRLARGGVLGAFARWFPFPRLLAPSVLRVQAFLELPFVTCTYLTVCRWFSADAYRGALRLAWPLSACATATFCLVEWSLRNPYTVDDLVLRVASGLAVPLLARWLLAPGPEPTSSGRADRIPGLAGLGVFVVSTVALGAVVMTVYDTALLYNLGDLPGRLPETAAAITVLAAARAVAHAASRRESPREPGPGTQAVVRSFGVFLVLFAVPALPLRYAMLSWGTRAGAAAAGLAIVGSAVWSGVSGALTRTGAGRGRLLTGLGVSALAGAAAGSAAYLLSRGAFPETRFLWVAAAFLLCGTAACAWLDRRAGTAPDPDPGSGSG